MIRMEERLLQRVVPREAASNRESPLVVDQLAIPRDRCPSCAGKGSIVQATWPWLWVEGCPECEGSGFARNAEVSDRRPAALESSEAHNGGSLH